MNSLVNSSFSPSTSTPDTGSLREDFARDGFAVARGVFDARETLVWRDECERLLQLDLIDPDNLRTPFDKSSDATPKTIEPVTDISPLFSALARDERILGLARACLDDEPLLFKDKLIWKMPGAGGYKLHQDREYWPIGEPQDLVAVSIHVDAADVQNGCLEIVLGENSEPLKIEAQPGDVVLLNAVVAHQSADNGSLLPRRSLYFTFNAARAAALFAAYETHYQESLTEISTDARDAAFFR